MIFDADDIWYKYDFVFILFQYFIDFWSGALINCVYVVWNVICLNILLYVIGFILYQQFSTMRSLHILCDCIKLMYGIHLYNNIMNDAYYEY